jgi:5-methyltetrahydropteroyltriglutamate--homocysteine methyltransferase
MIKTHVIGFPRIGGKRELKWALEAFWGGELTENELNYRAVSIMRHNWVCQKTAGLDYITAGDFSLYDHVLDITAAIGAVPPRFRQNDAPTGLGLYFSMARGDVSRGIPAMEMTKWFDTNYHYLVPEFYAGQRFKKSSAFFEDQVKAAGRFGRPVKLCLLGPVSYIMLGKEIDASVKRLDYLDAVTDVYIEILQAAAKDCALVQLEEPILNTDIDAPVKAALSRAYGKISSRVKDVPLMLAAYFSALERNMDTAVSLPVQVLHVDLCAGESDFDRVLQSLPDRMSLSLGIVNGRNIWRTDMTRALAMIDRARAVLGSGRLLLSSSCSLLHVPVDLDRESALDPVVKQWMAFAVQKCRELSRLKNYALNGFPEEARDREEKLWAGRAGHPALNNRSVRKRMRDITPRMLQRDLPFAERNPLQKAALGLPPLPTTTIGSFPQTGEIRKTRRALRNGAITDADYTEFMREQIKMILSFQENIGLDVLVHGEVERNDMVEYFGQQLDGFCFTGNGWVQSYGSRCVKPPVIYGDVSRPHPMTVPWMEYALKQSRKPVKGMLTGPVTILCWSFVRDDLAPADVCRQIALAVRDEAADLEKSGISVIQIDEPAFREGMPLRRARQDEYLGWAVECFHLASCGVKAETQVHTHMCYSEFNSIIKWIAEMDADVISIEASRSRMELLSVFDDFNYPNEIGPGVYDIHSPRIPGKEELKELINKALRYIPAAKLWINPDCGLKTRTWPQVEQALTNMVRAAAEIRTEIDAEADV